jgi:hypothetical protein
MQQSRRWMKVSSRKFMAGIAVGNGASVSANIATAALAMTTTTATMTTTIMAVILDTMGSARRFSLSLFSMTTITTDAGIIAGSSAVIMADITATGSSQDQYAKAVSDGRLLPLLATLGSPKLYIKHMGARAVICSEPNDDRRYYVRCGEGVSRMAAPVYNVVFHEGHWRIRYENLYFGEFGTAETAAQAALEVARSRIAANGVCITINADGEISVGEPADKA